MGGLDLSVGSWLVLVLIGTASAKPGVATGQVGASAPSEQPAVPVQKRLWAALTFNGQKLNGLPGNGLPNNGLPLNGLQSTVTQDFQKLAAAPLAR